MKHAWCHDIARDEAVRAAEDNRTGPLPTLEEAIAAPFACAACGGFGMDHRCKASCEECDGEGRAMIPKSVSGSNTVEHENKGESMREKGTKRDEQAAAYRAEAIARPFAEAAERSSTVSETGEGQSGMVVSRVTLEITTFPACVPAVWPWRKIMGGMAWIHPGESVRVVDEAVGSVDDRAYADRIGCDEERDFANRILDQRDAALRERDQLRSEITSVLDRSEQARSEHDALRARVADLEARNVTPGEAWCVAPAASGIRSEQALRENVAAIVHDAMRFEREGSTPKFKGGNSFAEDRARQAATEIAALLQPITAPAASGNSSALPYSSGAASGLEQQGVRDGTFGASAGDSGQGSRVKSGEPVAWMCEWTDHVGLHHTKTDAEDEANGDIVPQPLYRELPQPRGWLTAEERKLIGKLRKNAAAIHLLHIERDTNGFAEAVQQSVKTVDNLFARSSPPEVVLVEERDWYDGSGRRVGALDPAKTRAALAAAGVPVKEVQ
jgi:hypothetical protein